MIVIDASTLAKYILKETNWSEVKSFLLLDLCSIDHIAKEVANAIWKHTVLYRRFTKEEYLNAINVLKKLLNDVIVIESQMKYLDKAIDIAFKYKLTIYDSLYIAQALRYEELLTSDEKQAEVARDLGVKVYYIK